jgi:hypothetical protein
MSFDTRIKQMQAFFATNFTGVVAAQIQWDNVREDSSLDKDSAWIAVSIQPNVANFASIGTTRRVRHEGFFVVQVFTPVDETTESANDIAQNVADTLEGELLPDGVLFKESRITRVGVANGYYQLNVFTAYQYDDMR